MIALRFLLSAGVLFIGLNAYAAHAQDSMSGADDSNDWTADSHKIKPVLTPSVDTSTPTTPHAAAPASAADAAPTPADVSNAMSDPTVNIPVPQQPVMQMPQIQPGMAQIPTGQMPNGQMPVGQMPNVVPQQTNPPGTYPNGQYPSYPQVQNAPYPPALQPGMQPQNNVLNGIPLPSNVHTNPGTGSGNLLIINTH